VSDFEHFFIGEIFFEKSFQENRFRFPVEMIG